MALSGLLAAASPVLGAFGSGSGQSAPPDTSSAAATVTTNTTLRTGAMTQFSGTSVLLVAVVLYLILGMRQGKAVHDGQE